MLVLDEADKLLELGFKDAIFEILHIGLLDKNQDTLKEYLNDVKNY